VGAHESITAQQALHLYTAAAAAASFAESERGTITPGLLADFVALSNDPLDEEADALLDTHVVATVVGGQVVFGEL
jgi:hypothetical protein